MFTADIPLAFPFFSFVARASLPMIYAVITVRLGWIAAASSLLAFQREDKRLMLTDDFGRNSAPTAASIEAPRRFQLWFPASVTSSRGGVDAFGTPSPNSRGRRRCIHTFLLTCLSVQTGVQEQAPVWAGVGRTPCSPRLTASSKISSLHENLVFFPPPGIRKYP